MVLLVLILGTGLLVGCGQEEVSKEVNIGYVNWAEGIAMTNLAQVVIEDELGYDVTTTMADVGPTFQGLASGDTDAFMDVWLPVTHQSYIDKLGDDIVRVGTNYSGARIGLVVPEYVEADSIEELNEYRDKFDGEIIGIDAGAGIMKSTRQAIETYNLDFELLEGSGAAMTASLKTAIDNDEWIVVTGWNPHWKFSRWDLKFLEDPEGVYGEIETIYTYSREGLEEDHPEVVSFLENFEMNISQLGDLMGAIADSDKEPLAVARQWKEENQDLINSWID
ncbi:MAG: glycine betaine ABC transporter substrate-binding protein [Bacillota bacterium]